MSHHGGVPEYLLSGVELASVFTIIRFGTDRETDEDTSF